MSAITNPGEFVDTTTAMALEEKAKLQKHFTRFDIYFFLICTIVGVDTLGVVAAANSSQRSRRDSGPSLRRTIISVMSS